MFTKLLERYKKYKYTKQEKPYLRVSLMMGNDGQMLIDSEHNVYAISKIEEDYAATGVTYFNSNMSDTAKLAIYLSDTMNTVASNYLPDEFKTSLKEIADDYAEDMSGTPTLSDSFVTQTIDGVELTRG